MNAKVKCMRFVAVLCVLMMTGLAAANCGECGVVEKDDHKHESEKKACPADCQKECCKKACGND